MHALLSGVLSEATRPGPRFLLLYYSDNVFAFDRQDLLWISMDVAKMESSSTVEEGRASMEFIMSNLKIDGRSEVPQGLSNLMSIQGAELAHDVLCVRGDSAFRASGLSTGSPNTFLQNHTRMAAAVPEMDFCFNNLPDDHNPLVIALHQALEDPSKDVTLRFPPGAIVPFDLELTAVSDTRFGPYARAPGISHFAPVYHTLADATMEPRTAFDGDYGHGLVRTDVLGFDTVVYGVVNPHGDLSTIYVGVLSWERIWKIIMFRKTDQEKPDVQTLLSGLPMEFHEKVTTATTLLTNVINLGTLIGAYLVGGFAYFDTEVELKSIAVELALRVFRDFKSMTSSSTAELTEEGRAQFVLEAMQSIQDTIHILTETGMAVENVNVESYTTVGTELAGLLTTCRDFITGVLTHGRDEDVTTFKNQTNQFLNAEKVILALHYPASVAQTFGVSARHRGRE